MFPLFFFLMLPFICFIQRRVFFPQTRRRRDYSKKLQLCVKLRTLRGDASQFGETEGNKYSDFGFCFAKILFSSPLPRLSIFLDTLPVFLFFYKDVENRRGDAALLGGKGGNTLKINTTAGNLEINRAPEATN
mgnify:CR=1 FL=1